jgi:hypothetical protein
MTGKLRNANDWLTLDRVRRRGMRVTAKAVIA